MVEAIPILRVADAAAAVAWYRRLGHQQVYLRVVDLDEVARTFAVAVEVEPWGRQLELTDPDGNRLRIGEALPD